MKVVAYKKNRPEVIMQKASTKLSHFCQIRV